jgi:cytoskeletal protein CcmA (bactofilin family)
MSNNSWKQYGGQSKADEYNIINASTIIADQFVSRSVKTGSYFLSGTLEVSNDISAGFNIIAGQTLCTQQNLFVNEDLYSNKKIYFGAGTEFINSGTNFPILASDNSNVFIYGDASFVAINALSSDATLQVNGTNDETKNILVVESVNDSLRNILGQNKNNHGIAIKVNDSSSNILFYNDTSTNIVNEPNANISYISNDTLMQNTVNDYTSTGVLKLSSNGKIVHSSDIFQVDNSGGRIYMDNSGFVLDSSGAIVLNAYGITVEASGGNMLLDVSGNYFIKSNETQLSVNENIVDISSNNITLTSTNGNIGFDSSGGKIDVISDIANFYSHVKILSTNQDSSSNVFNETLTVFDSSNNVYLENVYDISGILTGSAITGVSKDASSNTFMHLISRNTKQGAAYGGGVYPLDTSRSMNTIGINDNSGNYVMNQTIVSNKDSAKYLSTLGINTFAPKTNEYVMDLNGPMRISNGEINNVANTSFEIQSVSFSKNNLLYGIACGTPTVLNDLPINSPSFSQTLLYTKNGGIEWAEADVYNSTTLDDLLVNFNSSCLYDANYGIIGGNSSYLYYTNNGGSNWYRMQNYESGSDFLTDNTYRDTNSAVIVSYNSNLRVYIAYKYNDPDGDPVDTFTKQIRYFDIPIASLSTDLNGDTYKISTFNEISITSDINISYGTNSTNYLYYVGNGIMKVQISDSTITYTVNTTSTYSHIYAYDDNFVIAVGDNIISYTNDGTTWTNIAIDTNTSLGSNIILNHVHIYDTNNISVVGNNGVFAYTTFGPEGSNWQLVSNTILNSSGNAHLINDSQNTLKTVHMIDKNTLIISNVLDKSSNTTDDSNDIAGKSKLLYVFLPNLYFKLENNLLDICGNMTISGNIQTYDGYIGIGKPPSSITALDISANNAIQLPIGNNSQRPVSDNSGDSYKGLLRYNNEIDQFEGYGGGDIWGPLGGTDANGDLVVENDLTVNGRTYLNTIHGQEGVNGGMIRFEADIVGSSADLGYAEIHQILSRGGCIFNDICANDISVNTIQADNLHIVNPITSETIVNISTTNYDEVKVEEDITVNGRFFVNEITNTGTINTNIINATTGTFDVITANNGTSNIGQLNITGLSSSDGHLTVDKDITTNRIFIDRDFSASSASIFSSLVLMGPLILNNQGSIDDALHISTSALSSINATITGDLSINNNLYVSGDVSWNSANIANDSIPQSAIIGGNSFSGGVNIDGDLSLNNRLFVGNNATFSGDVSINNNLYVSGDVSINNNIYVSGDVSWNSANIANDSIPQSAIIDRNDFTGAVAIDGDLSLNNRLFVGNNATISGYVSINNNLYVSGDVSWNSANIANDSIPQSAIIGGNGFSGGVNIDGDLSLNNRLFVGNNATFSGDVSINSSLYISGDVSWNSTNIPNDSIPQSAVIDRNDFTGAVAIDGDLNLNNRLFVGNNATISGDVSINNNLYVSGDVSWNSTNIANNSIPQSAIIGGVGSDTFTNDASMNKGLYINRNLLINAEEVEYFSTDTLPTAFTGSFPQANTTSRLTYTHTVSSYTGSDAWKNGDYTVVGTSNNGVSYASNTSHSPSASNPENVFNTRTYSSETNNTGYLWLTARSATNDLTYLDSSGNTQTITKTTHMEWLSIQFPFDLNITSFSFYQGAGIPKYVDVLVEYPDGNRYLIDSQQVNSGNTRGLTRSVSVPSHDYYGSKLYFTFRDEGSSFGIRNFEIASLKINGTVKLVDTLLIGFETNNLSIFNGDISLNGGLSVSEDVSFNNDLYVKEKSILNNDVSLNSRLFVAEVVSLNSGLYVGGDVSWNSSNIADNSIPQSAIIGGVGSNDFSGVVTMDSDLNVNGRLYVGGDVSWNSSNIADNSIPQSAIIGGVGSNDFSGAVSMDSDLNVNGRLFVDNDITLNGITTVNRKVVGEYSSNVSNFPSDLVSFSNVQYTLGETKTNTSGEVLVLGDYSWSTTTYGDGNNNIKLTYQLKGYTGSSYTYVVNNGVGSGTVNQITYVDDSNSNVLITEGTGSQHWIRLTAPRFMVIGKLRFATSSGNDLNKVPKNVYIVGTDEYGDKRLLGSKFEADLMYQTSYYIDLLDTPVSDVYFIYQTRGNYNAVEILSFQYQDVLLQETEEATGLISDAISIFNKTVTINDDLYVNGNSYTTGTATSSDDRLKHNEESIINALDTIRKLQPKHYYKTKKLYDANHSFVIDGSGNIIDASGNMIHLPKEDGFIAQEVENIPELNFAVHIGSETTPYALNYNSIFTRSIKAMQELDAELQAEKAKVSVLEIQQADGLNKMALLDARIAALENPST